MSADLRDVGRRMTTAAGAALPDESAAVRAALDVLADADLDDDGHHQALAALLARELARWMAAHRHVLQAYNALRVLVESDEGPADAV